MDGCLPWKAAATEKLSHKNPSILLPLQMTFSHSRSYTGTAIAIAITTGITTETTKAFLPWGSYSSRRVS